jgi:phospholipid transport system substrate-binding protein
MSFVLRVGTLALAWLLIGPVTPAWSGAPTDQLRGSIDRVLAIVNDPALQAPARAAERNAALRAALEARVDAARAARETLGLYWRDRTPQEQEQFTGLFRELLERTYMARIEAHAGAHVQ